MTQYLFNTGVTLNITAIPEFANLNTQQLPMEEIRILVDTSIARTVILPYSTLFPVRNVKITIVDITGNASGNNITIQASTGLPDDSINGAPTYFVTSNFGAIRLELLNANEWSVINVGAGGGASLAVNMTYAQLIAGIGANSLVTGQRILLTDYATSYYLQFSGAAPSGIGGEQVNVGAVEPLLLTATSNNTISQFAESLTNPQDTILYSPVMADGNYDYAISQGKGCITFRKDNSLNISRDYDWRTILFRRWETVIGNGKFLSFTPVAGAAFQDSLGLGSNVNLMVDVNVRSILSLNPLTGYPYWLDNTIFNTGIVVHVEVAISFGNTFTYFDDAANSTFLKWHSNETRQNVIVQNYITINEFGDFVNNSIIQTVNTQIGIQGNTIGGCSQNNIEEFYQNSGGIDQNTCQTIAGNTSIIMFRNTAATIVGNNVANISDNNISGAGGIERNVGVAIENNTTGDSIRNNVVSKITGNSNTQVIDGNVCDLIESNTVNVTEITGNIGSLIGNCSNVGGIIYNNFAKSISNVSGTGTIDSLTGCGFDQVVLNGDFKKSFGVSMLTVSISAPIDNANFNGEISGKTITPTANMQSVNPSVIKYDYGLTEFVEEVLTSGVVTYSPAITA